MEKERLVDVVLDEMMEKMYSASIIKQLVMPDVTDYERGKIAGKLEMLNQIATEVNPPVEIEKDDEEDDSEIDIAE